MTKEILVMPKLSADFPNCRLIVIDNDTGKEISRVFDKIIAAIYKPNKVIYLISPPQYGYTFLGEGMSRESSINHGKWKLRLIGEHSGLPTTEKNDVNHSFYVREITDYYVPLESSIFADYHVRVFSEHLTTIYAETSHHEIPLLLEVWDRDNVVYHAKGIGFVALPAVIFLRNGEEKHEYSVKVSALNYDWPMSTSEVEFVENLRILDANELNIHMKNEASSQVIEKAFDKGKRKEKPKSEFSPEYFDKTKPHWVLKIISCANRQEEIEVVKSISRNEELRTIKKVWEETEPGRYIKAVNSRLEYYKANNIVIKQFEASSETDETTNFDQGLQSLIKQAKEEIKVIDTSTIERNGLEIPLTLTENLIEELISEKENNLHKFNEWHENLTELRRKERLARDCEKITQIKELREMQKEVDKMHNETERAIYMLKEQKLEQVRRSPTPDSIVSKRRGSKKSLSKTKLKKK